MGNPGTVNEGKINTILALVIDMDDETLAVLMARIREEYYKRKDGKRTDTIQT